MIQQVNIGEIIDPAPARVVVTHDDAGQVSATFDLAGLPRVDGMLTGRAVGEVPSLVERLCGICPQAHHLAGVRALESLAGLDGIPVAAQELRRLLHYGSVISIHVVGLLATFPDQALVLRQFAKLAMAAAGSPGHFPTTAIPGGVTTPVVAEKRTETLDMVPQALEAARAVWESVSVLPSLPDHFEGADVALVDERGNLDLFGEYLRVVGGGGGVLIDSVASDHWDSMVAETDAGSSAPRPYLLPLGPDQGAYRVGPVAQLRVAPLGTPHSARLQKQWLQSGGGAPQARATIILHCVEVIEQILTDPILILDKVAVPWKEEFAAGVGVGWVDGARGLLVHRYQTGERGVVESAQILTPTAQNEPWLASLLTQAASGSTGNVHHMEAAIREADPCLPCSSAPVGAMGLVVDTDVRG